MGALLVLLVMPFTRLVFFNSSQQNDQHGKSNDSRPVTIALYLMDTQTAFNDRSFYEPQNLEFNRQ